MRLLRDDPLLPAPLAAVLERAGGGGGPAVGGGARRLGGAYRRRQLHGQPQARDTALPGARRHQPTGVLYRLRARRRPAVRSGAAAGDGSRAHPAVDRRSGDPESRLGEAHRQANRPRDLP